MIPSKTTLIDVVERALATFAQAFLAIEIADQSGVTQLSSLKVAAVAGALAVAKYLLVQANAFLASSSDAVASAKPKTK